MSEIANYLRLLINGDKEAVVTAVTADLTPTKFTSRLLQGYKRKTLAVYNNSHSNSGECHYSYSKAATTEALSHPIPKGSKIVIPIATDIDVYFFADTILSGELGDLRVEEIS